jgi:hypothetical protein
MTDLSLTIEAKSNQLNADDLMAGSRTIKVTDVSSTSEKDQPIRLNYEGDNGKPYLPCKSMRRVLVWLWGADGKQYVGRSMTIYRDPEVVFGGQKVGGIRISHLSNIDKPESIALTASKLKKSTVTIQPLKVASAPVKSLSLDEFSDIQEKLNSATYENKDSVLSDARDAYKNADDSQREKIKELTTKVSALSSPVSDLDDDELVL